jgi:hypothetical protein
VIIRGQQQVEEGTTVAVTMAGSGPSRIGAAPAGSDDDTTETAADRGGADSTVAPDGAIDGGGDGASADNV